MHRKRTPSETFGPIARGVVGLSLCLTFAACGGNEPTESRPITPSFETNKARAPIGSPIEITYRFEVGSDSAPIDEDYTVFVHFLDSHDALLFTDDHMPTEPTNSWTGGATIEYTRTHFIPLYPYLGVANVEIGLYVPETGERLGLDGTDTGHLAYQVGQIELLDQKENIFLVYKEGWHQLEADPDNPSSGVEWQWTKKEAVCSFRNPKKDSILYLRADTNVAAYEDTLQVSVLVGENEVSTFAVEDRDPFLKKVVIPASALGDDDWVDLKLVNSDTFVPSDSGIGSDARELGLRVFHLYIDSQPGT